jgi:hypothetical protein
VRVDLTEDIREDGGAGRGAEAAIDEVERRPPQDLAGELADHVEMVGVDAKAPSSCHPGDATGQPAWARTVQRRLRPGVDPATMQS